MYAGLVGSSVFGSCDFMPDFAQNSTRAESQKTHSLPKGSETKGSELQMLLRFCKSCDYRNSSFCLSRAMTLVLRLPFLHRMRLAEGTALRTSPQWGKVIAQWQGISFACRMFNPRNFLGELKAWIPRAPLPLSADSTELDRAMVRQSIRDFLCSFLLT